MAVGVGAATSSPVMAQIPPSLAVAEQAVVETYGHFSLRPFCCVSVDWATSNHSSA